MNQYFPTPCKWKGCIKVELDLSNFATNADLERAIGADRSNLATKSDLAGFKPEVSTIDTDKLKTSPADLADIVS